MGGIGGHIQHVYELDRVKNLEDMFTVYKNINPLNASLKIDGVNISLRFVERAGWHQWVVDRGSMKPLDVSGVTEDTLVQRFGEGHGLIPRCKIVLDIMNEYTIYAQSLLKDLGFYDNPNLILNIEYVDGKINTVKYPKSFIAIHGLKEVDRSTGKCIIKDLDVDIKNFVSFLQDLSTNHPIPIINTPTIYKSKDCDSIIEQVGDISINNYKDINIEELRGKTVTLKNGKVVSPFNKNLYISNIYNKIPLLQIVDLCSLTTAYEGVMIQKYNELLGDLFLNNIYIRTKGVTCTIWNPFETCANQEGVVVDDGDVFKITGSFSTLNIINNPFGKEKYDEYDIVPPSYIERVFTDEDIKCSWAYWFKHWSNFQAYSAENPGWKFKDMFHDCYKPFLNIFLPYNWVRKIHKSISTHHSENIFKIYDKRAMILDEYSSYHGGKNTYKGHPLVTLLRKRIVKISDINKYIKNII